MPHHSKTISDIFQDAIPQIIYIYFDIVIPLFSLREWDEMNR